ncbi:YihY/virulence factor BrkB family protein [Alsobacter sp. SYSU M60028]|uniref:YihY/virulence factor BrkB family protein n=1 Tax=Alsobacter ponti TaxID=2962936 RepID=A0ABT1LB06_9HYPH|nr:YihY/virulence factor BrkB family protein [Alsobacter ponti]MCP8938669.1 YihY/virulence factor BrkB family protein [Alsobacter ponti]
MPGALRSLLKLPRLFWDAYWRLVDDDGWAIASHIALSALMSLFPFLIFVTALAATFGTQNLGDAAADIILEAWPKQVAEPITREVRSVLTRTRSDVLTVGAALALYFSSNGIEALRIALNRAYGLKELRAWWLTRLESIAYVVVAAIAILALSVLVVLGPFFWNALTDYRPGFLPFSSTVTVLRLVVATLVIVVALTIVHKWLPCGTRKLEDVMPGVLLTVVLWLGYALAFAAYLGRAGQAYVTTYAGLASVMIALVFLYAIAATFIFGGEFNAVMMHRRKMKRDAQKTAEKA